MSIQALESKVRESIWLMRIASKEINLHVTEFNKDKEPWLQVDAETSYQLDKLADELKQILDSIN